MDIQEIIYRKHLVNKFYLHVRGHYQPHIKMAVFPCWNHHLSKLEYVDAGMALEFLWLGSSPSLLASDSEKGLGKGERA